MPKELKHPSRLLTSAKVIRAASPGFRRQSFRRVSWKSARDCNRNADS